MKSRVSSLNSCQKIKVVLGTLFNLRIILFFSSLYLFLPSELYAVSGHADLQDAEAEICFKCHKDLAKPPEGGHVHPPFESGDCTTCHELQADNTFAIMDTGDVLCYMCHDEKNTKAAVHGPVASGDCTLCHSPHQSPNPKMLLDAPLNKLCFNCHDEEIGKQKHVHVPVAGGECGSCHDPHESPYSKQLVEDGKALCFMCHVDKEETINNEKHVHSAIEMVGCTGCHSPHGSGNKFQLLKKMPDLCFECHDEDLVRGEHIHAPVAGGECLSCHDPHASPYSKQLVEDGVKLCLMCHFDKEEEVENKKHVHSAIEMAGCTGCHSPHASENKFQLLNKVPDLCFECHSDIEDIVKNSKTPHGAMEKKGSCLNCHDPHASDFEKQLKSDENMELCLKCHNRVRRTARGFVLNMKRWLKENPEHHGPILMGDCSACHSPHGSDEWRMLRKAFPSKLYTPFKVEKYALCFDCHDEELVLEKNTSSSTGFRNGKTNLHYIHVNDPEKGRRCVVCHNIHATKGPKHVRESASFGQWELPINFEINDNGGRCAPGCHFPRGYNRIESLKNR